MAGSFWMIRRIVRQEAHVAHAIGLVQYQRFNPGQIDVAVLPVVQQAAGAGDDNRCTSFDGCDLPAFAHASVNGGAAKGGVTAQVRNGLVNLFRQFTGGGEDEGTDPLRGTTGQALQNWQHEGCGFSRSGLGNTHQVASFKNDGDCLLLDGGGYGVAGLPNSGKDV